MLRNSKEISRSVMNIKEGFTKYINFFFRKVEQKREKELDDLLVKKIKEELDLE